MSVPARKVRTIAPKPAMMTPFYFLKAGSLIEAKALIAGAGLITVFLAMKMVTKFVGILPLTRYFKFDKREGMYTTLRFDRFDLRIDLGTVRSNQSHYRPRAIYNPVDGSNWQRGGPDSNCAGLVPTSFRAVGGRCLVHSANVRFGVISGHFEASARCPLCANSGHLPAIDVGFALVAKRLSNVRARKGLLEFCHHHHGSNRVGNETIFVGGMVHFIELFRTGFSVAAPYNLWA